jgi:hypothetical protein
LGSPGKALPLAICGVMVKVRLPELPPPGVGLEAETCALPAMARSDDEMLAVNCVPLPKAVVRALPFQFTTEVETNPDPVIVKVKSALPTFALVWESDVTAGAGLLTLKVLATDDPPPGVGLVTVTAAVPAVERSVAGTEAVTLVLLTNVVVSAAPAQFTTVPETKFVPVTVSVKPALPTVPVLGAIELTVGAGLLLPPPPPDEVPPHPTNVAKPNPTKSAKPIVVLIYLSGPSFFLTRNHTRHRNAST